MPPMMEEYLAHLEQRLTLPAADRMRVLAEVRQHLSDRLAELGAEGHDEADAVRRVLSEVGGSDVLAGAMSVGLRGRRWKPSVLAGLGLAASVMFTLVSPRVWQIQSEGAPQMGDWAMRTPADVPAPGPVARWQDQSVRESNAIKEQGMRQNRMLSGSAVGMLGAFLAAGASQAAVPQVLNHQGVVTVDGTRFTGTGAFRFAIVDPQEGDKNRWTSDGSQLNMSAMPAQAVSVSVTDGVYSVRLGESPMASLSASVFADGSLALRVWFDDGTHGVQQLAPDHDLTATPYAMLAETVSPGSVSTASMADGAVTADKIAHTVGVWNRSGSVLTYPSGKISVNKGTADSAVDVGGRIHADGLSNDFAIQVGNQGPYAYRPAQADAFALSYDGGSFSIIDRYGGKDIRIMEYNDSVFTYYIWIKGGTGRVGIGNAAPQEKLDVTGNIRCHALIQTCSRAAKQNIAKLSSESARIALSQLEPVTFEYRTEAGQPRLGFIAEDVPELLATPDRTGLGSMDIVAVLTKVVQEQQQTIEQLHARMEVLEKSANGTRSTRSSDAE